MDQIDFLKSSDDVTIKLMDEKLVVKRSQLKHVPRQDQQDLMGEPVQTQPWSLQQFMDYLLMKHNSNKHCYIDDRNSSAVVSYQGPRPPRGSGRVVRKLILEDW